MDMPEDPKKNDRWKLFEKNSTVKASVCTEEELHSHLAVKTDPNHHPGPSLPSPAESAWQALMGDWELMSHSGLVKVLDV